MCGVCVCTVSIPRKFKPLTVAILICLVTNSWLILPFLTSAARRTHPTWLQTHFLAALGHSISDNFSTNGDVIFRVGSFEFSCLLEHRLLTDGSNEEFLFPRRATSDCIGNWKVRPFFGKKRTLAILYMFFMRSRFSNFNFLFSFARNSVKTSTVSAGEPFLRGKLWIFSLKSSEIPCYVCSVGK